MHRTPFQFTHVNYKELNYINKHLSAEAIMSANRVFVQYYVKQHAHKML